MTKSMLGTTAIAHIALVVHDIEATSQMYADFFGIENGGWFWSDEFGITHTEFRGKSTEGRAKITFLDMGSLKLELIEPDVHPSTWREHLDRNGEGVHHIAFFVEGMKEKISLMEHEHMPVLQKGENAAGQYVYAYMDTYPKLKLAVELLEHQRE